MPAKTSLEAVLYRGVLLIAKRAERAAAQDAEPDRERWRESVRTLMLRQIMRRGGTVDEDGSLEGYVCACEGHNHSATRDTKQYAALNAKDTAERIRRLLGQGKPAEEWLLDDDADDEAVEPSPVQPARAAQTPPVKEQAPVRPRVLEMPERKVAVKQWQPSLADKLAHAKWGR